MTPGRPGASAPRDRDEAGRPRNARPRDALGRPLSRDPALAGPGPPDDQALAPAAALAFAQQLIDDGRPFRAHEVLEASWRAAPAAERELWRGLAQVAVGLTHAQRGNARGAVALLRRGGQAVGGFAATARPATASPATGAATMAGPATVAGPAGPNSPSGPSGHGADAAGVARSAAELARRIEREGLAALTPADLKLSLLGPVR
jgi:hypothetical protein